MPLLKLHLSILINWLYGKCFLKIQLSIDSVSICHLSPFQLLHDQILNMNKEFTCSNVKQQNRPLAKAVGLIYSQTLKVLRLCLVKVLLKKETVAQISLNELCGKLQVPSEIREGKNKLQELGLLLFHDIWRRRKTLALGSTGQRHQSFFQSDHY